ncbi:MAG: large conductance mechanosensitive channel protein MscL [Oscillospiraceae bacterium]|nr:large conductance mechanosensitive channel protein MscL [Oscillospiraceae bacterium]
MADEKKGFLAEFKEFALRGNVMDMAIGTMIGGAFATIITALTENVINPILGCIGTPDVDGFVIPLIKGQEINIGALITAVINFLIMALVLFCILKATNKLLEMGKKKKADEEAAAAAAAPAPEPTKEELLLTEIRDLLAKK